MEEKEGNPQQWKVSPLAEGRFVCAAQAAQPGEMKDGDGAVCSLLSAFPWFAFEAIPRRKDNKFVRAFAERGLL